MAEKNEKNQPYESGDQKEGMKNIQEVAGDKTKEMGSQLQGQKEGMAVTTKGPNPSGLGKSQNTKVEAASQRDQFHDIYDSQQGGFIYSQEGASDLVTFGERDKQEKKENK
ncbi:unnamed protein product [Blepharisma stoltei]|uniref:Uncharacterized protein n=1 Tax=Blepharisma stoltei TaxID=1481888 RepID=A0AAU9IMZ2_9CILI|nr:unnamed protein product [Blepharisma stoltei]